MFRAQGSRGPSTLPRISPGRKADLVVQALEDAGRRDVRERLRGGDRSVPSTRRYLEHLVTIGKPEMRPRYGVAGRPGAPIPPPPRLSRSEP